LSPVNYNTHKEVQLQGAQSPSTEKRRTLPCQSH